MSKTALKKKPGLIIYGPQGSGKSRNKHALRRYYRMARVLDDDGLGWWRPGMSPPRDTLVLTHQLPPEGSSFVDYTHIDDALAAAGIDSGMPEKAPR